MNIHAGDYVMLKSVDNDDAYSFDKKCIKSVYKLVQVE